MYIIPIGQNPTGGVCIAELNCYYADNAADYAREAKEGNI